MLKTLHWPVAVVCGQCLIEAELISTLENSTLVGSLCQLVIRPVWAIHHRREELLKRGICCNVEIRKKALIFHLSKKIIYQRVIMF